MSLPVPHAGPLLTSHSWCGFNKSPEMSDLERATEFSMPSISEIALAPPPSPPRISQLFLEHLGGCLCFPLLVSPQTLSGTGSSCPPLGFPPGAVPMKGQGRRPWMTEQSLDGAQGQASSAASSPAIRGPTLREDREPENSWTQQPWSLPTDLPQLPLRLRWTQ